MVLKLGPRGTPDDAELASEAATLAFWRPSGAAIELLDERDEGFTLLLEHALPGHSLDQTRLSWDVKLAELGRLARRDSGKAIDPHGARGDRHAEIWALICPEAPALPEHRDEARRIAWRQLRTYADAAGLDPEQAALWARVRARAEAESSDVVGDPAWAERLRRMAHALAPD